MNYRMLFAMLVMASLANICVCIIDMGQLNQKYKDREYLVDSIREIKLDEEFISELFVNNIDDNGACYISGIDKNCLSEVLLRTLYRKDNVPILFEFVLDSDIYNTCMETYNNILECTRYFPVADDVVGGVKLSYEDSWGQARSYGGKRLHEGTDIMSGNNVRGYFPVVSVSDGLIEKVGWLKLGGYRVGIRSDTGAYYYYAHLCDYEDGIKEGERVKAGDVLGTMGDSGYSEVEGTTGEFPVHLHFGVYYDMYGKETSFNPYYILRALEQYKREFI